MNKFVIVALFAILTFENCSQQHKDFFTTFLKQATQEDVKLGDKCFGTKFDLHLSLVWDALQSSNVLLVFEELDKLQVQFKDNCPGEKLNVLINTILSKIKDASIFIDLEAKKGKTVQYIIELHDSKDFSGKNLGKTFGNIVGTFIGSNKLSEFERKLWKSIYLAGHPIIDKIIFELSQGFFTGLTRYNTQSQCFNDILKLKVPYRQRLNDWIRDIQEGIDFFDALFMMIKALWLDFSPVKIPCRNDDLPKALNKGLNELLERIFMQQKDVCTEVIKVVEGFQHQNLNQIGKGLGKLFDLIFDFYVN